MMVQLVPVKDGAMGWFQSHTGLLDFTAEYQERSGDEVLEPRRLSNAPWLYKRSRPAAPAESRDLPW